MQLLCTYYFTDPRVPFENQWLSYDPLTSDDPYSTPDEWSLTGMVSPLQDFCRVFCEEVTAKRIDLSNCLKCQSLTENTQGPCLHTATVSLCCSKCDFAGTRLRDILQHHKDSRHLGSYYAYVCRMCNSKFCSNESFSEHLGSCIACSHFSSCIV